MYWINRKKRVLALEEGDKIIIVRDGGGKLTTQVTSKPYINTETDIEKIVVEVEKND